MPTLVANHVPPGIHITLHSKTACWASGRIRARPTLIDLINAGKETVTELPGASYFSSADSFAMVRGGTSTLTVLRALQVDEEGNLANWMIPGKMIKGMGGAMDRGRRQEGHRRHGTHHEGWRPQDRQACTPFTGEGGEFDRDRVGRDRR
jgi:3-oxoacid CoA-transferase subunit B